MSLYDDLRKLWLSRETKIHEESNQQDRVATVQTQAVMIQH